jgi:E3 ubiquitin-protein ligase DOA10
MFRNEKRACPICYCTIAPTSGLLPRMMCPTCSNAFHKECVIKWFATSNDNGCPLCRQPFRQLPS